MNRSFGATKFRLVFALEFILAGILLSSCGVPPAGIEDSGTSDALAGEVFQLDQGRRPAEQLRQPGDGTTPVTAVGASIRPSLPVDGVLYAAGSVVRGTVASVDGPFWNQADGQVWKDSLDDYTVPFLYREIHLDVTEILRDDIGIKTGELVLLVNGADPSVETDRPSFGGSFTVGEEVYVAVTYSAFFMREAPIDAYQILDLEGGVFRIEERGTLKRRTFSQEETAISDAAFRSLLTDSRAVPHPEWDRYRNPLMAADVVRTLNSPPPPPLPADADR